MNLKDYFENTKGTGILGTANAEGKVDLAVYARPHVIDENNIAFIMREKLSHQNLKSNSNAAYLFIEDSQGYKGIRLYLAQTSEEVNTSLIEKLRRKTPSSCPEDDDSNKYLVFFRIEKARPLVGDNFDTQKQ